jgi:hypothetical protein
MNTSLKNILEAVNMNLFESVEILNNDIQDIGIMFFIKPDFSLQEKLSRVITVMLSGSIHFTYHGNIDDGQVEEILRVRELIKAKNK